MKPGKFILGVVLAWMLVAGLDAISNLFILSSAWKGVAAQGIVSKAVPTFSNSFVYTLVLLLAVTIMGLFYAYGGHVCALVSGKFWLGFGCGTLINIRFLTQFIYTDIPFSIIATELLTNWFGFVVGIYILAKIYGPGAWATNS